MNQKAKKVCVITVGSSGIGFSSAKRMGKKGYFLVLAARTPSKLDKALTELTNCGIKAATCPCDISDWTSVQNLAKFAASLGTVTTVLHIAGMSPHMGEAEKIMAGNAMGTIYIHEAFYPILGENGVLIDTSSMSAYLTPRFIMPQKAFKLSQTDKDAFFKKMMARVNLMPPKRRAGAFSR